MKIDIVSCPICCVVLDRNRIIFPDVYEEDEDGDSRVTDSAEWDGDEYVAFIRCPVCKQGKIYERDI